MRIGGGGRAAVGAAAALLAATLAGGPLYVSSAASEALQVGLDRTCAADAGLVFPISGGADATAEAKLDGAGTAVANTEPPISTRLTRYVPFRVPGEPPSGTRTAMLMHRQGQEQELDATLPAPTGTDVLAPAGAAARFGWTPGTELELVLVPAGTELFQNSAGAPVVQEVDIVQRVRIAALYPDIPVQPEPSYWCGLRELLRPTPQGDPRPPVLLASVDVVTAIDRATRSAVPTVERRWELRPDPDGLTRREGEELAVAYDELRSTLGYFGGPSGLPRSGLPRPNADFQIDPVLGGLLRQAEALSTVVARTIAPIRLAGVVAAVVLLAAGGALVAREGRRELRLRLLRGESPGSLARRTAVAELPPVLVGTVVGIVLALAGVRWLGPTPEVEPSPLRVALLSAAIGAIGAAAIVGAVAAAATNRSVDAPARSRHRRLPWELLVVALAILSWQRLDRAGGVRLVGADTRGGDLLAQAFPLLAVGAIVAVLARPLRRLAERSRRVGGRLPSPVLVGLRRVGADPAPSVAIALAVALALGAYTLSTSLTSSAQQLLQDKADTYLGSHLVGVTTDVYPMPAGVAGTVVTRVGARSDGLPVDVVGVDPVTFAAAVPWRGDAADVPLQELLEPLGPGDPLPAIVVGGPLASTSLIAHPNQELEVEPVATARWFPGQHAGSTYVVVDRTALQETGIGLAEEIWVRDPPADVTERLTSAGFTVRDTIRPEDVFEVTSFLAVRWSYGALAAFGMVIGCVAVLAQLLVLDARRRSRQAAWVLARPMGLRARDEAASVLTELAVPFAAGALIGVTGGILVARLAVGRLDSLRGLEPPARLIVDMGAVATAAGIGVGVLVVLSVVGVLSVLRTRPMEVMRGGA